MSDAPKRLRADLKAHTAAVIACGISGKNARETAAATGLGLATVHRIRKGDEYRAAIAEFSAEVIEQAKIMALVAAPSAVDALTGIMVDAEAPEAARVSAAKTVLDRVGLGPQSAVDVNVSGDLAKMSDAELGALALKIARELGHGQGDGTSDP